MKFKNLKLLILFSILISSTACQKKLTSSSENSSSSDKFAFIDRKIIETQMKALKNIEKDFSKEESKIRNDLLSKKTQLEEKYKKLEKDKSNGILDRKVLENKAKEIEKDFMELQRSEKNASDLMNFVKMQISFEINQKIQEAAREIGDKNGHTVIFDSASIFYINNSKVDDVTFEVLGNINSEFKQMNVEKYFSEAKKALEKMKKNSK